MSDLPQYLKAQFAELPEINPARPLILCDADEVILTFVSALGDYCETKGLELNLETLAITGNVRRKEDGYVLTAEEVSETLDSFFAEGSHHQQPVTGAVDTLNDLSEHATVLVLTNVPLASRHVRQAAMQSHGLHAPIIANEGPKGPAALALSQMAAGSHTFFIDDLPPNHISVAKHAPHTNRIHFVADPDLSRLMPDAEDAHIRAKSWAEIDDFIKGKIGK